MDLMFYIPNLRILRNGQRKLLTQVTISILSLCLETFKTALSTSGPFIRLNKKLKEYLKPYGDTRSTDLTSELELLNKFVQSIDLKSSVDSKLLTTNVVDPNLLFGIKTSASEAQGIFKQD